VRLDLFGERVVLAVVADLELLLLVLADEALALGDVELELLALDLALLLLGADLAEPGFETRLLVLEIADLIREVTRCGCRWPGAGRARGAVLRWRRWCRSPSGRISRG